MLREDLAEVEDSLLNRMVQERESMMEVFGQDLTDEIEAMEQKVHEMYSLCDQKQRKDLEITEQIIKALNDKMNESLDAIDNINTVNDQRQGRFVLLEKKTLAFIKSYEEFQIEYTNDKNAQMKQMKLENVQHQKQISKLQQLIEKNKEDIKDLKKDMARSQKGSMKDGKKLGSDKRESSKESNDRSGLVSKLPSDNKVSVKD